MNPEVHLLVLSNHIDFNGFPQTRGAAETHQLRFWKHATEQCTRYLHVEFSAVRITDSDAETRRSYPLLACVVSDYVPRDSRSSKQNFM
jgi:hypothetical protein